MKIIKLEEVNILRQVRFLCSGESAVTVEFGNIISPEINLQVRQLSINLKENPIDGVVETIPTFRSLLVIYNPCKITYKNLIKKLNKYLKFNKKEINDISKVYHVPVCYGGKYGEDLKAVSSHTGLSVNEVIKRHTGTDYLIYMMGFLPGFAYLGGLDEQLITPRLETPRKEIPAGSVGIGGEQTGIYPMVSPGGWRLIGRTPIKPYDINRENTVLYRTGDYIRFYSIDENEYNKILSEIEAGTYKYEITEKEVGR